MALTINEQFTRFVEFASARNDANNQNTIARLDSIGQGGIKAGRTIKEAEGDAVKKLFRADNLQRENDMTASSSAIRSWRSSAANRGFPRASRTR